MPVCDVVGRSGLHFIREVQYVATIYVRVLT